MILPVTKMHGLGNDFAVIDLRGRAPLDKAQLERLADRRWGVGCDQILALVWRDEQLAYEIYNADGSPAGQCGNGVRCLARWLKRHGEIAAEAELLGPAGPVRVSLHRDPWVSVDMGEPRLAPAEAGFDGPQADHHQFGDDASVRARVLSMGNPHVVIHPDDARFSVELARTIQNDPRLADSANVGFMTVQAPDRIALRVYERGVGETPACGSGACAAVVAGRLWDMLEPKVTVALPGGEMMIEWQGEGSPVIMHGPATFVYEANYTL